MRTVVQELISPDGTRRVEIFQRSDGSFGFEALRFSEEPRERCWIAHGRFAECFAATQEIAVREARGRVAWLRELDRAGP